MRKHTQITTLQRWEIHKCYMLHLFWDCFKVLLDCIYFLLSFLFFFLKKLSVLQDDFLRGTRVRDMGKTMVVEKAKDNNKNLF